MDFSYYKELTDYLYYETNGLINFTKKENEPSFLVPREAFIGGYILDYQLDLRAGILNIPKIENVKNSFYLSDDHFENYYDKASFSGIHLKHFFNENWSTEIYFLIPSLYTFSNVSSLNYNSYSSSNVTLNYENISYQKEKPKNTNYLFNLHYKMNENIFSISYYKGNYDIPLPFDLDYVNQLPVVLLKYPEYRWLELNWQVSLLNEKLKYKNQLAYIDPTDWHFLENQYWEKPFISYSAFIDYEMNSSTSIQLAYSSNHNIIEEWEDSSPLMCLEVKKSFHTIDLYAGLEYHFNAHQLNEGIGFKYQFRKNLSLEGGYFSNDRGFFQISYTF
ncbi:MAG: hypothetical protein JW870_09685 [Candidatus Delongbacteria bacterium]|nr:hypothetical protein [Candidatus Delongbacteria bacterium]